MARQWDDKEHRPDGSIRRAKNLVHPRSLPYTHFSVANIPEAERFAMWRESISCMFEVEADKAVRDNQFSANVDAHMCGSHFLAQTSSLHQKWNRTQSNIANDGMDHYMIQLLSTGNMHYELNGEQAFEQDDLIVYDLSQEARTKTTSFTNLSLIVPRDQLAPLLKQPDDQHLRVFSNTNPVVSMLREHMLYMRKLTSKLTIDEALQINPATVSLVAAVLNMAPFAMEISVKGITFAQLTKVKQLIDTELHNPALSPQFISKRLRLSRTRLYNMFEQFDGVAAFIRERRLNKARLMLMQDRHNGSSISQIATACGFVSDSTFSRAFRTQFNATPSDIRYNSAALSFTNTSNETIDRRYEGWLHRVLA